MKLALTAALAAGVIAACSSSPEDFHGVYSVQITNGSNGCNLSNFTTGQTTMDVGVTVTQNGDDVTAEVTGVAGQYVELVLGSDTFDGSVDGDAMAATLDGTRPTTSGNCTYTYNAKLHATLATNSLNGEIDYSPAGNGNSDCASIIGCVTTQAFAGSRAPQ